LDIPSFHDPSADYGQLAVSGIDWKRRKSRCKIVPQGPWKLFEDDLNSAVDS